MRKLLLFAFAALILCRCSKDDSVVGTSGYSEMIQGSWKDVSSAMTYFVDKDQVHSEVVDDASVVTFKNGKVSGDGNEGTYSIDENTKTLIIDLDGDKQLYNITTFKEGVLIIELKTTPDYYYIATDQHNADYSIYKLVLNKVSK